MQTNLPVSPPLYSDLPLGRHLAVLSKLYFSRLYQKLTLHDVDRYYSVLVFVDKSHAAVSQQDIGDFLDIDKATMVRVIDGFVEKDYLLRTANPNDRRSYLISLTAKGKAMIPVIQKAIDDLSVEIMEGTTDEEQKVFRKVTCLLTRNLKKPLSL